MVVRRQVIGDVKIACVKEVVMLLDACKRFPEDNWCLRSHVELIYSTGFEVGCGSNRRNLGSYSTHKLVVITAFAHVVVACSAAKEYGAVQTSALAWSATAKI
jgi:hypothetical protein